MPSLRSGSRQSERDEYDRPPLPRLDTSFDARKPSVTQRMQQGGWMGVDSRAGSPASSTSDMDAPALEKRDSADSGFAEPESGSYFGDWTKLKNAVWGSAETSPSAPSEGYGWSTLVAKAVSLGAEDDAAIGPDGDTKLGRCIKEYHISRAASPNDLPDWIFTATERSARATAAARTADRANEQRRQRERFDEQQDYSDRGNERRYGERSAPPPHRQFAQVAEGQSSYKTVTRRGSSQDFGAGMPSLGARRGSAAAEPGQSRAAGRLRAMTDAKRR